MCRINQTNKMENMIIHSQWRLDIIKLRVSAHSYVISTFPWFHQLFQNIFHGEDHFYPDKVSTILSVNFSLKTLDTPWSKMSPTHQFMCLWSSFGININEYIHWKPNIYKVAPWTYQNNKIPPTKMIPEGETMDLRLLSFYKNHPSICTNMTHKSYHVGDTYYSRWTYHNSLSVQNYPAPL